MMTILKYNDTGEEVFLLQKALNELTGKGLKPDGHFGKLTETALRYFQQRNRLEVDGIYGPQSFKLIDPLISSKYVRERDVAKRAEIARLPVNVIKGFKEVEAKGSGFLPDGRVIILFERHKFFQFLSKKKSEDYARQVGRSNPSICNPARGGYLGNEKEYPRLERAMDIDKECALLSASYGLFQLMGFNFAVGGYSNVVTFAEAMKVSEHNQLDAILSFINKSRNLKTAVRDQDMRKIAYYYNGPANATNDYVKKLTNAVRKYS